ncbi:hypothetical protein LP419_10730 [Massilia sp. H-1]|nr:hypothetical protein LP419_10730 [Massilia sp. H-1]
MRDRSGYYVRRRDSEAEWARLPERAPPAFDGVAVTVNRHVVQMLSTPLPPGVMPFASASLDPALLPQSHLSSTLMSIARRGIGHSASFSAIPGLFELRCGIARIMGERGVLCGPDDVLITMRMAMRPSNARCACAPVPATASRSSRPPISACCRRSRRLKHEGGRNRHRSAQRHRSRSARAGGRHPQDRLRDAQSDPAQSTRLHHAGVAPQAPGGTAGQGRACR